MQRKGRFELAEGGTIFLDEIADLTPGMQIRLLRVLQEREFERVGGSETIKADVRVIAATNRNIEKLIEQDSFRRDLYYRLNVFPIHIPPLRERKTDILLLADHFVEKYSKRTNKAIKRISTPAIDMLMAYHWPGNVRELENCIERATTTSSTGTTSPRRSRPPRPPAPPSAGRSRGNWRTLNASSSSKPSNPAGATGRKPRGCSASPSASWDCALQPSGSRRGDFVPPSSFASIFQQRRSILHLPALAAREIPFCVTPLL